VLFVSIVVSMEINRRHYFRNGLRNTQRTRRPDPRQCGRYNNSTKPRPEPAQRGHPSLVKPKGKQGI